MQSNFAMSLMSLSEFLLWATLGFVFWRRGLHSRFPAMGVYLGLRVASMPILLGLLYLYSEPWGHQYFPLYFFAYWSVYIASAITIFFVTVEIFRTVLSSFAGLMRLGTVAFRWAALVSLIVSLSAISFKHPGMAAIPEFAVALMRSVSIMELCLLAFLCLCMNALHVSVRDLSFGFGVGLGVMSANDFVLAALVTGNPSLTAPFQYVYEGVLLLALGTWVAYCALPEPARKPVVLAANSTIYRWNEIAAALGHGTKIAVQQPANSFFLTDVEKVVDKVLTRTNLQGSESKL
jgi:hypothetical protein